jgi:hypothetical protein
MVKHVVVYYLASVRDKFPFTNGISHERDVVYVSSRRFWKLSIGVQLEGAAYVLHKGGVLEPESLNRLTLYEGDSVTSNDVVPHLEGAGG